jgi:hypothetical protein
MKRMLKGIMAVLVIGTLASGVGGCGCRKKVAEKVSEKVAEKAIEHAIKTNAKQEGKDVDVQVDLKGGAMTIKSKDGKVIRMNDGQMAVTSQSGEENVSVNTEGGTYSVKSKEGEVTAVTGKNAKVPDNFPKDIPLYPGAEIAAVTTMTQQEMFSVQSTTADSLENTGAYFRKQFAANGWTEKQSMNQAGDAPMQMLTYSKEGRTAMVMLMVESGKTMINLQTAKE